MVGGKFSEITCASEGSADGCSAVGGTLNACSRSKLYKSLYFSSPCNFSDLIVRETNLHAFANGCGGKVF